MSDCASVASPGRDMASALASKSPTRAGSAPRAQHPRDQNPGASSPAHSGSVGTSNTATNPHHPQAAAADPAARRAAAARWVQRAAGLADPPPHETDAAFRAALRDGVLLCLCANAVWPGLVPGVVERADQGPSGLTRQRLENVTSFLDALGGGGGNGSGNGNGNAAPILPAEFTFSVADLEYEGADDRPRVADCVLWMRAQHLAMTQQQRRQQGGAPMSLAAAEAAAAAHAASPLAAAATPGHRSVQAAAGVTRLMQQCTAMLRERMFLDASGGSPGGGAGAGGGSGGGAAVAPSPGGGGHHQHQTPLRSGPAGQGAAYRHPSLTPSPAPHGGGGIGRAPIGSAVAARYGGNNTGVGVLAAAAAAGGGGVGGSHHHPHPLATPPPDQAIEAMGPILEGVLGSLTQEYERRLLSKDHELAAARDAVASLQRQAAELREEADAARREAAARGADAARLAEAGAAEDAERLRAEVDELRSLLDERERALADLERRAGASAAAVREREQQLERELEELREEAHAAAALQEKYARAVAENRRLYNTVQDLKGSIRVFCRVRPLGATGDGGPGVLEPGAEDGELALWDVSAAARAGGGGGNGAAAAAALAAGAAQRKVFKLDRVFGPGSSQAEVYEDTAPLVRCVLDGYNVCIFAYGQTGSGKTHTMSGGGRFGGGNGGGGGADDAEPEDQRGINYRALDDLFEMQEARRGEIEYRISVQMLEIYNEQLRDLLAGGVNGGGSSADGGNGSGNGSSNAGHGGQNNNANNANPQKLEILSTLASGCNVPGAVQVEVRTAADVAALMRRGSRNRATGGTRMNERSSRSHQVVTVAVSGTELSTGARSHACLHLVDLAGSERVARSEASGDRLVEAQHINRSLSALGDVMAALAVRGGGGGGGGGGNGGNGGGGNGHVPFRNSKLTHLLQDSLSGNAKVMMFVHVSPEASSSGESLSTLKFAARVSEVTLGPARRNGESGRVFEAKEAALAARRAEEAREHEAAALRHALEAEARRVDELSAENERLRGALSAARGGGPSPGGGAVSSSGGGGRRVSGDGGGTIPPRVPRLSLGATSGAAADYGAPLRSARLSSGPSAIPSAAEAAAALPPRPSQQQQQQTTPPRGGGAAGGGLRPLSPGLSLTPPAPYFGGDASANPGSGGGVVREVSSSQRHIDRLAAARARGGAAAVGGGGAAGGGGNDGSLTARGGRLSGGGGGNDGSLTARGAGGSYGGGPRASDVAMPMTARAHRTSSGAGMVGGVGGVAALRASVAGAGAVPRAGVAAGAGGGFSTAAGPGPGAAGASQYPSGSLTARGGSTARGGGRWK